MIAPRPQGENCPPSGADVGAGRYGLLATGSADGWDVAIDERLDGPDEWFLEIDGPGVYLVCRIDDLRVVEELARRLSRSSAWDAEPLVVGWFGQGRLTLIPDGEFKDRFFLAIESLDRSFFRLTLGPKEAAALTTALGQVVEELQDRHEST
jgi:hypothetical protein